MALSQGKLQTEIKTALDFASVNMTIFANKFATAYKNYAVDALDLSGDSLLTDGQSAMEAVLATLDAPGNILSGYATTVENACIAFWNASAFAQIIPPPGMSAEVSVVITPMSAGSIQAGLLTSLLTGAADTTTSALDHAIKLHAATLTVTTTHTGPSTASPFPIIVVGPGAIS